MTTTRLFKTLTVLLGLALSQPGFAQVTGRDATEASAPLRGAKAAEPAALTTGPGQFETCLGGPADDFDREVARRNENAECAVCFEEYENPHVNVCPSCKNSIACNTCFAAINKCPFCRTDIDQAEVQALSENIRAEITERNLRVIQAFEREHFEKIKLSDEQRDWVVAYLVQNARRDVDQQFCPEIVEALRQEERQRIEAEIIADAGLSAEEQARIRHNERERQLAAVRQNVELTDGEVLRVRQGEIDRLVQAVRERFQRQEEAATVATEERRITTLHERGFFLHTPEQFEAIKHRVENRLRQEQQRLFEQQTGREMAETDLAGPEFRAQTVERVRARELAQQRQAFERLVRQTRQRITQEVETENRQNEQFNWWFGGLVRTFGYDEYRVFDVAQESDRRFQAWAEQQRLM